MADKRIIELEERLTLSEGDYFATDNTNGTCKVNAKILLDRLSDNEDAIATKAAKVDLTNISITGSTNNTGSTITSGSFFYKNGTLVRAKTDIANNATLTLNTNYEIVTAGGLNALNNALSNSLTWKTDNSLVKTGANIITLPNDYNEIIIKVCIRTLYLPKIVLSSDARTFTLGATSATMSIIFECSLTSIKLDQWWVNGSNSTTSSAITRVYYR